MKMRVAVALAVLILGAVPAWAALGEPVSSVQADQKFMKGQVREVARNGYSLHEIRAADGNTVREYVSPEGTVFGVSWEGPTIPNLQQLLGSYFSEFQRAARSPRRRHGPLAVQTDHVVIESAGHMRAFHGRAYVPGLLPNTLTQAVVK